MKTILIAGLVLFFVIVLLIVILPFVIGVSFHTPSISTGADNQGVFVTEDGGAVWQARNTIKDSRAKLSGLVISDFVIDPKNHERLYVGTGNSGIFKSIDGGKNWEKIVDKAGVLDPSAEIARIAVSRVNPNLWFVAAYQKNRGVVLKSEDGGGSFKEVYFVPVDRFGVFDLSYDDATGAVVIVNGQGGLLESRDKGKSWRVVKWFSDGLIGLVVDPRSSATFYVLTSHGRIFKTTDHGASFTDLSANFSSFDHSNKDQNLVVDGANGVLYLGSDYGLLRSNDGGALWQSVPVIIPPKALPVLGIAINPNDSRSFFVSAQAQIYKTADGGTAWSIILSPTAFRVTKLVVDKANPDRIYLVSNR